MPSFLADLLDDARRRVDQSRARRPDGELEDRCRRLPASPDFRRALARPGVALIAEIKRASPSKGPLAPDLDAVAQARAYLLGGADAVSVLTEPDRFRGSLDDLRAVAGIGATALRKDFVIDPYQVLEAREAGAAAVLLIVAALEDGALRELAATTVEHGMTPLVEVHDEDELDRALAADASVVGVNARDLRTFEVDRDAFARLRPRLPEGVLAVAESGIRGPQDVIRAAAQGADAVLVGESLVTSGRPTQAVTELVSAGRPAIANGPAANAARQGHPSSSGTPSSPARASDEQGVRR